MAGSPRVFNCPSCSAGILIRAQGQTLSVACGSCGTVIDASNESFRIISEAQTKLPKNLVIPLGQRGKLKGVVWEVIGWMQRCDGSGAYAWDEYLLFNPIRGFRWLVEADGHWNFVNTIKERPERETSGNFRSYGRAVARAFGKKYDLFNKGTAKVTKVLGEFYWIVKVGETVECEDYICSPEILSYEKSANEVNWSLGEYVPADEIRTAFQVTQPMPAPFAVAPNQPGPFAGEGVGRLWFLFVCVLTALQFMALVGASNEEAFRGDFTHRPGDPQKLQATPQFELKHGLTNVNIKLYAPVSNSWCELQTELVNDETGETFDFEQGVEFYSGVDSDGSWSEGNRASSVVLSAVPAGKYHMNLEPSAFSWPSNQPQQETFSVTVVRDVATWGNFFICLLLLSGWPLFVFAMNYSFEVRRWSNSDFSPYQSGDSD